eukprot:s3317_g4.t1
MIPRTTGSRNLRHLSNELISKALQRAFGPSCCLHTDVSRLAQTVGGPRSQSVAIHAGLEFGAAKHTA